MTEAKANFSDLYNQADDFEYYRTLGALGYEIPQHGAEMFTAVLATLQDTDHAPTVLDVCCSYGVGGVLLKTDLRLEDIYAHYSADGERDTVVQNSIRLRNEHRLPDPPRVFGLDIADNAASFAVASESLDLAFVEDLETCAPSPELIRAMDEVDLITTTGGIGYVSEITFGKLLDASPVTPWVAAFCLRAYDYEVESSTLAEHGLVTEKSSVPVRQRRFVDDAEQRWATEQIQGFGLDSSGLEDTGWYYADFYLSRPAADVEATPLAALVGA